MSCFSLGCVLLLTSICLQPTRASLRDDETRLLNYLTQRHDKRTMPLGHTNDTFKVTMGAGIRQIIGVDEKNQIFDGFYYFYQQWEDEQLVWNPADFGGLDSVLVSEGTIWIPTIALENDVDLVGSKRSFTSARIQVSSSGNVEHNYTVNYKSSCSMSLKYFPFDKQTCTLTFSSPTHHGNQQDLVSTVVYATKFYQESNEFELIEVTGSRTLNESCCGVPIVKLEYDIIFTRRPMFYLLNMVLPCSLITLIAMFSFCIPPESGEKVGLGVTVLLSLTVFLLIVSDSMPPTSDFPLIGMYYFGITVLVSLSTMISVVTLSLHHHAPYQTKEVPRWLQRIFFGVLPQWLCLASLHMYQETLAPECVIQHKNHKNAKVVPSELSQNGKNEDFGKQVVDSKLISEQQPVLAIDNKNQNHRHQQGDLTEIRQFLQRYEDKKRQEEIQSHITNQWRYLTLIVDRSLFVFFLCLNIIFTLWVIMKPALVEIKDES